MHNRRSFLAGATAAGFCASARLSGSALALELGAASSSFPPNIILPETFVETADMTDGSSPVGVAIQFYFDISSSIDSNTNEYQTQLDAIAFIVESADFREAIFGVGGPGSAGICVGDFDHQSMLHIGWVDFRKGDPDAKYKKLADRIRNLRRRNAGSTSHIAALENADLCFDNMPWPSERKFVNLLTDGPVMYQFLGKTDKQRDMMAIKHGAVISTFITRGNIAEEGDPFKSAELHLTTPANTFTGKDGLAIPGGETVEVAVEFDTRGRNIARYQGRMLQAVRRQLQIRTAGLLPPAPLQLAWA